jgi:tRNA-dihydrouridine synthase A
MFGACLMGNAQLVADCIKAMRDVVSIPVTVKPVSALTIRTAMNSCVISSIRFRKGECEMFIIHARKAWLSGLSPKENREIPPLDYPRVYQLKRDFPHLTMSINGGIKSLEEAKAHLEHMDGVMVGARRIRTRAFWRRSTVKSLAWKVLIPIRYPWCGPCIRTLNAS